MSNAEVVSALPKPLSMGAVLFPAFVVILVCLVWLASSQNINWDEFYFLSHVHSYVNNEALSAKQTFYVHLFQWLAHLPGDELLQISAGRFVMVLCLSLTTYLVFKISREFVSANAAIIGAFAYLSSGYVIGHGASFRADPIAIFCIMLSIFLVLKPNGCKSKIVASAFLLAISLLITMKGALLLPAYIAVIVYRYGERRVYLESIFHLAIVVSIYLLLFKLHEFSIVTVELVKAGSTAGIVNKALLHNDGIFPRLNYIAMWALLSVGMIILALISLTKSRGKLLLCVLFFTAPVLSLALYRNAYPYFFPYITPTLAVVAAIGVSKVMGSRWVLAGIVSTMVVSSACQIWYFSKQRQDAQIQMFSVTKYLFPERVNYIDRNGFIPSYAKKGFFMSSWGVEHYRKSGVTVFNDIVHEHQPPLLIANGPALIAALYDLHDYTECCGLLPEDVRALKDNYIPYWGAIWVAGKRVELIDVSKEIDISISGVYRLEGKSPVEVNGIHLSPGETLQLNEGSQIVSSENSQIVQLVLNLPKRPSVMPLKIPLYSGFRGF